MDGRGILTPGQSRRSWRMPIGNTCSAMPPCRIRTNFADYGLAEALPCPLEKTLAPAQTKTRLKRLDGAIQERLINWGYAICDAAMRRCVDCGVRRRWDFPIPRVRCDGRLPKVNANQCRMECLTASSCRSDNWLSGWNHSCPAEKSATPYNSNDLPKANVKCLQEVPPTPPQCANCLQSSKATKCLLRSKTGAITLSTWMRTTTLMEQSGSW